MICKICNNSFANRKFKKHLIEHNISQQEYYDTYIGKYYCPICHNETTFHDVIRGYNKYCSRSCLNKSENHTKSVANTKLIRYGNAYYANPEKIHETLSRRTDEQKKQSDLKRKRTLKEKYNDENYNNIQKHKETCLSKYGVTNAFAADSIKQTIRNKYYAKSESERKAIYEKHKNTFMSKSKEELREIGQKRRNAYINKSDEEKLSIQRKRYLTKKKNHTFKTSKIEDECYRMLLSIYSNTEHGYKSKSYPFECDLYIPEIDTYIELNFHWTHVKHPYNKVLDKNILSIWKEKAKTSKYFENAIDVWTRRDVEKVKIAKQNNIKLLVFYTKDEFDVYLSQLTQ